LALQYLAALRAGNSAFIQSLQAVAEQFESRILLSRIKCNPFVAKHFFDDYIFLGQGPFTASPAKLLLKSWKCPVPIASFFIPLNSATARKRSSAPCLPHVLFEPGRSASRTEVLREMKELGGVNIAVCNQSSPAIANSF